MDWKRIIFVVWKRDWNMIFKIRSPNRMKITYPSANVNSRKNFTQAETSQEPTVTDIPEGIYTLIMYDPDANNYLHWLVTNLNEANLGDVKVPYQGPTPPSGTHTYVFVLARQQNSLTNVKIPNQRSPWDPEAFLQEYGLKEEKRKTIRVPSKQKLNGTNARG
jgi:phosphatidylethanolamine-binding protein (PEBP) family uncharacterized protein